jgi:hypothetical protein
MGFGEVARRREDVPVSDTQAYRQFGNAVVPDVVAAVGREVIRSMVRHFERSGNGCFLKGKSTRAKSKSRVRSA